MLFCLESAHDAAHFSYHFYGAHEAMYASIHNAHTKLMFKNAKRDILAYLWIHTAPQRV